MIPDWILTYTGIKLSYTSLTEDMINIEDIAQALSMTVRFNGHCNRYYSVAEHSVLVSHLVDPEHAKEGLMHDASEAYLGDVTKPLKQLLPDYQVIEEQFEKIIAQKFKLRYPWNADVKKWDNKILADEAVEFHDSYNNDWGIGSPIGLDIVGYSPEFAKVQFMKRYKELF